MKAIQLVEKAIYNSNNYGYFKIIKIHSYSKIDICFEKTNYILTTNGSHIRSGSVKDPFYPKICGVGFFGNHKFTNTNRKIYDIWKIMIKRCYSDNPYKSYINAIVCDDWHNFQNFSKWCDNNYIDGYQLDKDLLVENNKKYSSNTCVFVPRWLNNLFHKNINSNRDNIYMHKNMYYSICQFLNKRIITQDRMTFNEAKSDYIKQKSLFVLNASKRKDCPNILRKVLENKSKTMIDFIND